MMGPDLYGPSYYCSMIITLFILLAGKFSLEKLDRSGKFLSPPKTFNPYRGMCRPSRPLCTYCTGFSVGSSMMAVRRGCKDGADRHRILATSDYLGCRLSRQKYTHDVRDKLFRYRVGWVWRRENREKTRP